MRRRGAPAAQDRNALHRRVSERCSVTWTTADQPAMVDVSGKAVTKRTAVAEARVRFPPKSRRRSRDAGFATSKGPVFHTAIIAGVMAAKRTHELIPFCHPLGIENCRVEIDMDAHDERGHSLHRERAPPHRRRDGGADGRVGRGAHHLRHVQGAVARDRDRPKCACSRSTAAGATCSSHERPGPALRRWCWPAARAGAWAATRRRSSTAAARSSRCAFDLRVAPLRARVRLGARRPGARPGARRAAADRGRDRRRRPDRGYRGGAGRASGGGVARRGLRPALPRRRHARSASSRARGAARRSPPIAARTTGCPSRSARSTSPPPARRYSTPSRRDRHCPRKFVIESGVPLLDQPDPAALDNVNTPEEFDRRAPGSHAGQRRRDDPRRCTCSTSRCCASRPGAARRRVETAARHAARALRRARGSATASRCRASHAARRGQRRVLRLVAAARRRATAWCSSRRWRAADAAVRVQLGRRSSRSAAARRSRDPAAGGYASFEGWVRDHNEGRRVRRLEYEAFEALAIKEGRAHRRRGDRELRRDAARPACTASAISASASSRCGSA